MPKRQVETEKITIEVPKAIMDFLRRVESDHRTYLQHSLLEVFKADLDRYSDSPFQVEVAPLLELLTTELRTN